MHKSVNLFWDHSTCCTKKTNPNQISNVKAAFSKDSRWEFVTQEFETLVFALWHSAVRLPQVFSSAPQFNTMFFFACCIQSFCDRPGILNFKVATWQLNVYPLLCSSCCLPAGGSNSLLIPAVSETLNSRMLLSTMTFRSRCACGPRLPFTFPVVQQSVSMPEV